MRKFFTAIAALVLKVLPSFCFAEIVNERNVFGGDLLCAGYIDFLALREPTDYSDCHQVAKFLIEHGELNFVDFVEELSVVANERSSLRSVASAMTEYAKSNWVQTHVLSGEAARKMAISMAGSQDFERATLYSYLFQYIQSSAAMRVCRPEVDCGNLRIQGSIEGMMGFRYRELDKVPVGLISKCLLSTDGFLTPVREVLQSMRFRRCLGLKDQ